MDICGILFAGAIIGALARFLVPGGQPIGMIITVLVGIAGSAAGNYAASELDLTTPARWAVSIGVAILLVLVVAALQRTGDRR